MGEQLPLGSGDGLERQERKKERKTASEKEGDGRRRTTKDSRLRGERTGKGDDKVNTNAGPNTPPSFSREAKTRLSAVSDRSNNVNTTGASQKAAATSI